MDEKGEIINSIGELKGEVVGLKRDYKHLDDYMFMELKPDIEKLCKRVELCTKNAAECYSKNLKWMVATLLLAIIAVTSLAAVVMMAT